MQEYKFMNEYNFWPIPVNSNLTQEDFPFTVQEMHEAIDELVKYTTDERWNIMAKALQIIERNISDCFTIERITEENKEKYNESINLG